jgi:hypothetical protein
MQDAALIIGELCGEKSLLRHVIHPQPGLALSVASFMRGLNGFDTTAGVCAPTGMDKYECISIRSMV